jgi:hypothetical protein
MAAGAHLRVRGSTVMMALFTAPIADVVRPFCLFAALFTYFLCVTADSCPGTGMCGPAAHKGQCPPGQVCATLAQAEQVRGYNCSVRSASLCLVIGFTAGVLHT